MSADEWFRMQPPPPPSEIVRAAVWGRHRKPWYRQLGRELQYFRAEVWAILLNAVWEPYGAV
jgi:hypothetical protein